MIRRLDGRMRKYRIVFRETVWQRRNGLVRERKIVDRIRGDEM